MTPPSSRQYNGNVDVQPQLPLSTNGVVSVLPQAEKVVPLDQVTRHPWLPPLPQPLHVQLPFHFTHVDGEDRRQRFPLDHAQIC